MKSLITLFACLFLLILLATSAANQPSPLAAAQAEPAPITQPNPVATQAQVEDALQSAPVMFIENVGQFDDDARFHVRGGDYDLWLANDALWITLLEAADENQPTNSPTDQLTNSPAHQPTNTLTHRLTELREDPTNEPRQGVNLKLSFVDANLQPEIEPFNLLETKMNYFLGNDEDKWRSNVPVWGGVRYKNIYPGIDLELTSENGRSVQRLVAHSRADLDAVQLRVEGADEMELVTSTDLIAQSAIGDVTLPLFALVTPDGSPLETNDSPILNNNHIQAPFAPANEEAHSRVPDSTLTYSTFIGGSNDDYGKSLALDNTGNAIVTGWTYSSDFPTTTGSYDTSYNGGNTDIFVLQLSSTGDTLIYSTFIGGSNTDYGTSLALDSAGNPVVTGGTGSSDFPTTAGSYDTTHNGSGDAFVLKLNGAGNALLYNTFVGGSFHDDGSSLALDSAGNAVVTGGTQSSDFPTTAGSYDTTFGGGVCFDNQPCHDTFVFKLSSAGDALLYNTFIGGSSEDVGNSLALDHAGNAIVTGYTFSSDFPTTAGSYDTTHNERYDTFVFKLSSAGDTLSYSTFIGGSNNDYGRSLALDSAGNAVVTGNTFSSDFPTTAGSYDTTFGGGTCNDNPCLDTFVLRLSSAGDMLLYNTFIGGSDEDLSNSLVLDSAGNAIVTGKTSSSDFPTTEGSYDTIHSGCCDIFVLQLSEAGDTLLYSTFIGGSSSDYGNSLALDSSGNAIVTGYTFSSDFPTTAGGYDTTHNGDWDRFVLRLDGLGNVPIATPTPTFTSTTPPTATSTRTPTPTNTPNVTRTPTPTPSGTGDAYESDDTCAQARPIPTDGTIQPHNFHAQNDRDWLSFDVTAGVEYAIQARVPSGSSADVILEVYGECDTVVDPGQDPSFSPDVRIVFEAPTTGTYHLHLLNHDPNEYGADVSYSVSVRALESTVNPGALVVVAGRLFDNDERDLQANIQHVTNNVYRLFRSKNYPPERIRYLATELNIDATGDGQSDVSALASKAQLQHAITQWTADKELGPERAFTLYLMDHGGENGIFYLDNPRGERVTAQELDAWLAQLEASNPGVKVNLIIEACYSGGFVRRLTRSEHSPSHKNELLRVLGAPNRVIISSTDPVALAYASPKGAWFSDSLLDALSQDMSLAEAFEEATRSVLQANPAQLPLLDGNGDGIPNRPEDYQAAAQRGFAIPGSFADDKWAPYIKRAEIRNLKNGQAEIWAEIEDDDQNITSVSAVVQPPSYQPTSQDGELVSSLLPENLFSQGNNQYGVRSSSFSEEGTYRIIIYAQDIENLQARPVVIEMQVGGQALYLPLVIQ